ncbi:MAG: hypothetical protein AAF757_00465 [Cyanobacteria bacterium P01_D01_bin.116]
MSLTQKIGQVIALSTLIFGSFIPTAFSATTPQKNAQESKPQTLLARSVVNGSRFKYQINGCRRVNRKVVCEFLVTNITNRNQRLNFRIDGSRAISLYGDTYNLQKIVFGKISITRNTRNKSITDVFTPGIPIKLNYHFAIPQGVNRLAGIEIQLSYYSPYKIGFRNIPIGNSGRVKGGHNGQ